MGIIGRKAITIPFWVKIAIAVVMATPLTAVAVLLTWGSLDPVGGKAVLTGAILAIPLIFAAKSEWSFGASIALAFLAYFSMCFLTLWFFTREKTPHRS